MIKTDEAITLGLKHRENIYGDAINHFGCRSFWVDKNDTYYKVEELYKITNNGTENKTDPNERCYGC